MDETKADETRTSPQGVSEAERLATEYCARRAAGQAADTGEFLEQLATEEEREQFRELAQHADLAMRLAPPQPERERVLNNRYRLDREIGAGGMGRVFAAFDQELERRVAIKVLSVLDVGDPEREDLLLKESRILAGLQHPGIVSLHETGRDGELFYVVMDLIDGVSMANVIERIAARLGRESDESDSVGPIRGAGVIHEAIARGVPDGRTSLVEEDSYSRTVARVLLEITRTLEAAHSANVIHRDIKPSNVMLIGGANPIVLDFGLAGSTDRVAGAITEGLYGTVSYLAPEQARSHKVGTDKRTDVYQLGLLLYEFLTLRRAYGSGAIAEVLERVKHGDFELPRKVNAAVPKDLQAICVKAMEVAPGSRYQTVRELREDLETFLSQDGIPKAVKSNFVRGVSRRARVTTRRHPVLAALLGMAFVGLGAWQGTQWLRPKKSISYPLNVAVRDGEIRRISEDSKLRPGDQIAVQAEVEGDYVVYVLASRTYGGERFVSPIRPKLVRGQERVEPRRRGDWGTVVTEGATQIFCQEVEQDFDREGLRLYADDEANLALEHWFDSIEHRLDEDGSDLLAWSDASQMLRDIVEGSGTRGLAVPEIDDALLVRMNQEVDELLEEDEYWSEELGFRSTPLSWPVVAETDPAE